MQLISQNIQIIEKVVRNENGLFLARFAILNSGGEIRWKLLDCTAIENEPAKAEQVILLEAPKTKQIYTLVGNRFEKIVSPIHELLFFISQPTRAPGF